MISCISAILCGDSFFITGLPDGHRAVGPGLRGAAEGAVFVSYDDLAAAEFQTVNRDGNFMSHACQLICRAVPIGMFHGDILLAGPHPAGSIQGFLGIHIEINNIH